jgi:choline transport protein
MDQGVVSDAAQLAAMGYVSELPRNLSPVSMLGLAFAILNSWSVLSASLSLSLSSGGPVATIWGLVAAGICNLCLAASLAEFLSAYPTAGGQYHWIAVVSPRAYATRLAWVTGWITVFGWIAVTASGSLLGSQLVMGIIASNSANHGPRQFEEFLLYVIFTLMAFAVNYWMNSVLPSMNKTALLWSVLGFVGIPVAVLALSDVHFADPAFVFGYFINKTGWPG